MKYCRAPLLVLFGTFCQVLGPLAHATEYVMGLKMDVDAKYDDNIRLVEDDKTAISGVVVAPILTMKVDTALSKTELDARFSSSRYDESNYDTDNQDIQFSTDYQLERLQVGIGLGLTRDSTVTSETDGSGRIGDEATRHERYQVGPFASYDISEVDQIKIQGSLSRDDYKSDQYSDYTYTAGNIDWIHTLNERIQLVTRLNYSYYESDYRDIVVARNQLFPAGSPPLFLPFDLVGVVADTQELATTSRDKGVQLGAYYLPTEQISINVLAGTSRNTTEYLVRDPHHVCRDPIPSPNALCTDLPSSDNSLFTTDVDASWQNELHRLTLGVGKSSQPTGDGYTLDSLKFRSGWGYKLNERTSLNTQLSWIRNRVLDSNNTRQANNSDRDYGNASITLQRQLSETWYATASYTYRQQDYVEVDYFASSNTVSLGILYQPQQWYWSR